MKTIELTQAIALEGRYVKVGDTAHLVVYNGKKTSGTVTRIYDKGDGTDPSDITIRIGNTEGRECDLYATKELADLRDMALRASYYAEASYLDALKTANALSEEEDAMGLNEFTKRMQS